jgi:hypothetical protein
VKLCTCLSIVAIGKAGHYVSRTRSMQPGAFAPAITNAGTLCHVNYGSRIHRANSPSSCVRMSGPCYVAQRPWPKHGREISVSRVVDQEEYCRDGREQHLQTFVCPSISTQYLWNVVALFPSAAGAYYGVDSTCSIPNTQRSAQSIN